MSKRKQQQQRKRKQTKKQPQAARPVAQTAFTEIEEAFFAAGTALCAEHASAHVELAAAPPPRISVWRRMLMLARVESRATAS